MNLTAGHTVCILCGFLFGSIYAGENNDVFEVKYGIFRDKLFENKETIKKVMGMIKDGNSVTYITEQLGWEEKSELQIRFDNFPFCINANIYTNPETATTFIDE